MAIDPGNIFAVLIGINDYLGEAPDLYGCINDVRIVQESLKSLGVQAGNISVLTSPPSVPDNTKIPTKGEALDLIRKVATRAAEKDPESLFFLHYSGHGDRVHTRYPGVKEDTDQDEVLCTLNEDISDVEVVDLLKELEDKGLTVLVVLDCCHSGGADRGGAAIRRRSSSSSTPTEAESAARGVRNAKIRESWFYRDRGHTLIAACQPHELASEYRADDGDLYGAMTTYEQLQDLLDSCCGTKFSQQPLLLGDRNRILFGKGNLTSSVRSLQGSVTAVGKHSLILNKGAAHGISLNDRLWIYSPTQSLFGLLAANANPVAEACVDRLKSLKARATLVDEPTIPEALADLGPIDVGWCAQLERSGSIPIVGLTLSNPKREDLQCAKNHLEEEWKETTGSAGPPVDLRFSSAATEPSLLMEIHEDSTFSYRDKKGALLPNIPILKATDGGIAQKLFYLLPHLCAYQRLAELASTSMSWKPSYELTITEYDNKDDDWEEEDRASNSKPLAAWKLRFKNTGKVPVYVTIFNLSPAYGVSQIFPLQNASSGAVDENKEIPALILDMQAPSLLQDAAKKPGFKMRDIIKVIITSEATSFGHYLQPDLEDWKELEGPLELDPGQKGGRNTKAKVLKKDGEFFVDEREIFTAA